MSTRWAVDVKIVWWWLVFNFCTSAADMISGPDYSEYYLYPILISFWLIVVRDQLEV